MRLFAPSRVGDYGVWVPRHAALCIAWMSTIIIIVDVCDGAEMPATDCTLWLMAFPAETPQPIGCPAPWPGAAGAIPSFDRSYFQRIASPLREYGVRSPDLSFEINALHPDYEMGGTCAMLAIFAGSKCVIQGTTCHM
jgi:hypothetical protein